jgi:hypothetical protein
MEIKSSLSQHQLLYFKHPHMIVEKIKQELI